MYRAPLRELRFVLIELLQTEGLARSSAALSDYSGDVAEAILEEAGRFAETVLDPINRAVTSRARAGLPKASSQPLDFAMPIVNSRRAAGRSSVPIRSTAARLVPQVLVTAVQELWASANLAFKLCPMLTHGAVHALELCGTPEQKQTLSAEDDQRRVDRHHGSHRAAGRLRSRADPHPRGARGRHYRLFGQKIFITWGDHDLTANIIHMVLARIEGAPAGRQGHLAVHRAEGAGERRWLARRAQRSALRIHRAQARHPREPDLRAGVRRERGRGRLPGRASRIAAWNTCSS